MQNDGLKWKQSRDKIAQCLRYRCFLGCLCYLYLPPSAFPLHLCYHHINAFLVHNLFIQAPGAFICNGYFTVFILAQARSFPACFPTEFLLKAWGIQPAPRQGMHCLSLLWFCCYQHKFVTSPNWLAFTAVLPIPLTWLCFKERSLYRDIGAQLMGI